MILNDCSKQTFYFSWAALYELSIVPFHLTISIVLHIRLNIAVVHVYTLQRYINEMALIQR